MLKRAMTLIRTFIALVLLIQVTFIGWSVHCLSTGTKNTGVHMACLALNLLFGAINVRNLLRSQQEWVSPPENPMDQKQVWLQTPD